ncbi:hypothetical protein ACSBR2_041968 [Camellia fascicularis]
MVDERNWGSKPFCFINAWVFPQDFLKEVKRVWETTKVERWAGYVIMEKLRTLKLALKIWNVEVFGNVDTKLKEAEDELHGLDLIAEGRSLNIGECSRWKEVNEIIWKLRKRKEWLWLQKSRMD